MRKHIVIVSEESVHAGHYKCGVGEVVDYMAKALREYYDVTIVTPGKGKSTRRNLVSLGVYGDAFYDTAAEYVNEVQPDLVHNFGRPDFITKLNLDCPKVLSFDRWEEDIADYLEYVPLYDHVVALSNGYATEMLAEHPEAAEWPLKGIINGIDKRLYIPGGVFNRNKPKEELRKILFAALGKEDTGKPLFITTGRLTEVKGTKELIESATAIAEAGAEILVAGTGDPEYEEQLNDLHEAGVLNYVRRMGDYCEICTAISGSDFYLTPSLHEVCGLQPMKAARMGCVPIVRPVGGMGENFNESNAVLITDGLVDAVTRAMALSAEEYEVLRDNCMAGEWTWDTRILPWIDVYGLPTAPKEAAAATTFAVRQTEETEAVEEKVTKARTCPFAKKEG